MTGDTVDGCPATVKASSTAEDRGECNASVVRFAASELLRTPYIQSSQKPIPKRRYAQRPVLKYYPFPHSGLVSGNGRLTLLQVLEDFIVGDGERFGFEVRSGVGPRF